MKYGLIIIIEGVSHKSYHLFIDTKSKKGKK